MKFLQQKVPFSFLFLFLLLFSFVFIWLNQTLFFKEPAVWPDEAIFADIATNFINEGRLGTHLAKGAIPNIENSAPSTHPLYLWSLIVWFKLLGISLLNQRLFSFALGICSIFLFYLVQKLLLKNNQGWLSLLVILMFAFDFTFNKAIRVGRPEILMIFLSLLTFYLFFKYRSRKGIFISGLFMGLTSITHTIGFYCATAIFLYLLFTEKFHLFFEKKNYLLILGFSIPFISWILYIWPNIDIWQSQFIQASLRKGMETPWVIQVFQFQPNLLKALYVFYLLSSISFLFIVKKNKQYLFLGCLLLTIWIFTIIGKMFWYFGLLIPYIYLSFSVLFYESLKNQKLLIFTGCLFILGFSSTFLLQKTLIKSFPEGSYSYEKFGKEVLRNIPESKTVFITSIPDPYFAFKNEKRNNPLYQFPASYIPENNYYEILNDSDYIVYTGSLEEIVFGDFLKKYIKNNQKKITNIGSFNQYSAQIIELVPKEQRLKIN